jgi:hypothetical protein
MKFNNNKKIFLIFVIVLIFQQFVEGQYVIYYDGFTSPNQFWSKGDAFYDDVDQNFELTTPSKIESVGLIGLANPIEIQIEDEKQTLGTIVGFEIPSNCPNAEFEISVIFSNSANIDLYNQSYYFVPSSSGNDDIKSLAWKFSVSTNNLGNNNNLLGSFVNGNNLNEYVTVKWIEGIDPTYKNLQLSIFVNRFQTQAIFSESDEYDRLYGDFNDIYSNIAWYEYFNAELIFVYVYGIAQTDGHCSNGLRFTTFQANQACNDFNCSICELKCENNCPTCVAPNQCNCPPGLRGSCCSDGYNSSWCPGGCNGGACVAPNTCSCPNNYQGSNCTQLICNMGTINVTTGNCDCNIGWGGINCNNPKCPEIIMNGAEFPESFNGLIQGTCLPGKYACKIEAECLNGIWVSRPLNHCERSYCDIDFYDGYAWPRTPTQTNSTVFCMNGGGNVTRYCDYSGQWSIPNYSQCRGNDCPAEIFKKARYTQANPSSYNYGECIDGYVGDPLRYCDCNGQWVNLIENTCHKPYCGCADVNGAFFDRTTVNQTVTRSCSSPGVTGTVTATCQPGGTWTTTDECSCPP